MKIPEFNFNIDIDKDKIQNGVDNFIENVNMILKDIGGILALGVYLALVTAVYWKDPYNIVSKNPAWSILAVLVFGYIVVMMSNFAIARDYFFHSSSDKYPKISKWLLNFGTSLLFLFLIGFSIYGIIWITSNFGRFLKIFSSGTYYLSILLGIGILYKFIRPDSDNEDGKDGKDGKDSKDSKSAIKTKLAQIFNLVEAFIFYVPCLIIDIIYNIAGTKKSIWILLLVEIVFVALYLVTPIILESKYLEIGHVLASDPQYLNNIVNLDQENLRKILENSKDKLQYALSADIWITPQPTSTNSSYTRDTNLLSFGDRLHIEYNGKTPTKLIIKALEGQETVDVASPEIRLQRWNKIILNYDHGILDVFVNGKLIHSQQNVPYMTASSIYAGSKRGIHGGIKNIRFFNKPLSKNEIDVISII